MGCFEIECLAEEIAHQLVRFGGADAELHGEALPGGDTEPGHPDDRVPLCLVVAEIRRGGAAQLGERACRRGDGLGLGGVVPRYSLPVVQDGQEAVGFIGVRSECREVVERSGPVIAPAGDDGADSRGRRSVGGAGGERGIEEPGFDLARPALRPVRPRLSWQFGGDVIE